MEKRVSWRKVILYYSAIIASMTSLGGFVTSTSGTYFLVNVLFLPVPIILWLTIWENKSKKDNHFN